MSETQFDFVAQDEELQTQEIVDAEVKQVAPMEFVTVDYAKEKGIDIGEQQAETQEPEKAEAMVKPENEEPIVEKTEIVEAQPTVEPAKEIDPFEALGFTEETHKEYLKKIAEAIKSNSLNDLIKNMSVNYDAMDEQALLEYEITEKIKAEYPNISDKALMVAVDKEKYKILNEYDITNEDEAIAEAGMELFKLRMDKVREGYKTKQAEYQPPKYEPTPSIDPQYEAQQKQIEQAREKFVSQVEKSQFISDVERTKVVSFGDLKLDVPEGFSAKEQTLNVNTFLAKFFDSNGNLDEQRWVKAMAIAENPDKTAEIFINYGKSLKEKEQFEAMRGIKNEDNAVPNNQSGQYVISDIRYTDR